MSFHHLMRSCVIATPTNIHQVLPMKSSLNSYLPKTVARSYRACRQQYPRQVGISREWTVQSKGVVLNGSGLPLSALSPLMCSQPRKTFSSSAFYFVNRPDKGRGGEYSFKDILSMMGLARAVILGGVSVYVLLYMWAHRRQARQRLLLSTTDSLLAQQTLSSLIGISATISNTGKEVGDKTDAENIAVSNTAKEGADKIDAENIAALQEVEAEHPHETEYKVKETSGDENTTDVVVVKATNGGENDVESAEDDESDNNNVMELEIENKEEEEENEEVGDKNDDDEEEEDDDDDDDDEMYI